MKKISKRKWILIITFIVLLVVWWFTFPSKLFHKPYSFVIEDKDGQLLGATIAADGQWRFPTSDDVPEKFVKCITTYEDKRFFYHPGIDPLALVRSVIADIRAGHIVQGGSTLSMQVMRMSRNADKRNFFQKFIECVQAVRLECTYSKKEILALYAGNAPFGGNVVGLEAAAWRYYGRSAGHLSWGETAALAILPNAPSLVYPGKNRQVLLEKRNNLLRKLFQTSVIDSNTFVLAKSEPLPGKPLPLPQFAPHLLQRFKSEHPISTNPICHATIDLELQKQVDDIVNRHHEVLKGNAIRNACAIVIEVETGNVLAYVGNIRSSDPDDQSMVDIIKAPRSPGSALKPILYAAAMSDGQLLPNMLLPDVPTQIGGYTPQNFDRNYEGAVPASLALSKSLNIPAVKILQQYKYARYYELLQQLGITTLSQPPDHYGLSMILGGCEVTLWDLAGIYAGMARSLNHAAKNKGRVRRNDFFAPQYILEKPDKKNDDKIINSLDATSTWFTFQSMQELMRPGEEGLWEQFTNSKKIAWKTGTSFGFRDAWAIGISSKYVVGVWVGNASGEGRPELLGVKAAAPVMFDIFRLLPSAPPFPDPQSSISYLPVCRTSGFRAGPDCDVVDTLMTPPNGNRTALCPYHQRIHLDASGQYRVDGSCYNVASMKNVSWFVLPPTMEWYYRQAHHDYLPLPPVMEGCNNFSTEKIDLIYPVDNSRMYIPLEMDGSRGKIICIATNKNNASKIYWHLDGAFIGTTTRFHQMAIDPAAGEHTLTLVDESGERKSVKFTILKAAE